MQHPLWRSELAPTVANRDASGASLVGAEKPRSWISGIDVRNVEKHDFDLTKLCLRHC